MKIIKSEIVSEYGDMKKRRATVVWADGNWRVDLYEDYKFIRSVNDDHKSQAYAESIAENWVDGVLNYVDEASEGEPYLVTIERLSTTQSVVYADSRHQAVEKAQKGLGRTVDKAVDLIKGTAEPYNE